MDRIYRPEIDGLRSIAVLLVILFHAGLGPFNGGFIGVDVFFVISGYLIYSILLREFLTKGYISLKTFYLRRSKRLIPALSFVVLVTFLINIYILPPSGVYKISKDSLYALFFISNFRYFRMDYFETGSKDLSLLHTWSLGLEEQFYLVFPIFLIILIKYFQSKKLIILLFLSIVSFFICLNLNQLRPNLSFYMLPARAWEFGVGILAAETITYLIKSEKLHKFYKLNLDFLGLIFILFGAYLITGSQNYPNLFSLLPVFGSYLIIVFSSKKSILGFILSRSPIVFVGLISYSLYLWHQPVFVLGNFFLKNNFSTGHSFFLIFITFILSILSWRYIEVPFRAKSSTNFIYSYKSFLIFFSLLIIVLSHSYFSKGYNKSFLNKLSNEEKILYESHNTSSYEKIISLKCNIHSRVISKSFIKKFNECTKDSNAIIVFGDSHAMDIYNMLAVSKAYPNIFGISQGGCRHDDLSSKCHYAETIDFINENIDRINKVYINLAGNYMFEDVLGNRTDRSSFKIKNHPEYELNYEMINSALNLINLINQTHKIIFLGPNIEPHISVKKGFYLASKCKNTIVSPQKNTLKSFNKLDIFLKQFFQKKQIEYVSIIQNFKFDWTKDFYECKKLYWKDGDHTSIQGDRHFSKRMLNLIQ